MRYGVTALLLTVWLLAPKAPAQMWVELNRRGSELQEQGSYRESEKAFLRAHALACDHFGENHATPAVILHNLAVIYVLTGRFSDAERCLKRTLIILENALGPEHPLVAENLNSLGALYFRLHRYEEAEPFDRRALAIEEKIHGPEDLV